MTEITDEEVLELAMAELKKRNLYTCPLSRAESWLHSGWIGQDDYDLLSDAWTASPKKLSVLDSARRLAIVSLRERFEKTR
jgi:hypothetical protein